MKSINFPYSPKIDQLRFFAAILVFSFHFQLEIRNLGEKSLEGAWWGLITQGHTGVALFFTLSGFLFMQIALSTKGIDFSVFIRNRFLRIFPLFFTIFLVATSIGRDRFMPYDIFYLLASNLGMAPTSYTEITGAAWCISLEFLFYVLFPVLSRIAITQGPIFLFRLIVLMIFFKLAAFTTNDHSDLMYFSTFVGRFDQFLIGMLAAFFSGRFVAILERLGVLSVIATIGLVIIVSSLQAHVAPFSASGKTYFWIFWSILESTSWAIFIIVWTTTRITLPHMISIPLQVGGKVSYSFYLLHMAVIHTWLHFISLQKITSIPFLDISLTAIILFGLTWLLSIISFVTIEEPFLQMRRDYRNKS